MFPESLSRTKPKFICIFGQKENGKTTLANAIRHALNHESSPKDWQDRFEIRGFADPLKDILHRDFGWSREFINKWKNSPVAPSGYNLDVRTAMEQVGEVYRRVDPLWFIKKSLYYPNRCIFDDGRVWDEAIASRNRGGFNIFIYRESRYAPSATAHTEKWVGKCATRVAMALSQGTSPLENLNNWIWQLTGIHHCFDYLLINCNQLSSIADKATNLVTCQIKDYLNA